MTSLMRLTPLINRCDCDSRSLIWAILARGILVKKNGEPCIWNSGKKWGAILWVKIANLPSFILYSLLRCCSFATLTP